MIEAEGSEQYRARKIVDFIKAQEIIADLKESGKKVGLCHGGFDMLHPGHVRHFESAKTLCDVLFVSITSDWFVCKRKGGGRPVFSERLRAYIAAMLEPVDYVVISDFEKGVEVIEKLRPSYYIKGPDFISKKTPGIEAERKAIADAGGEMLYTNDPKLSTTDIIKYIKEEVDTRKALLVIDRDGTIVEDAGFLGKNKDWKKEIRFMEDVISLISKLQTRFNTTNIIVSNQAGVGRGFFDEKRVEDINGHIGNELAKRGITIAAWEYCQFIDRKYSDSHPEYCCRPEYVMEKTKRKPAPDMVVDALSRLGFGLEDFSLRIVIGDKEQEDGGLARAINARFINVEGKDYATLEKDASDIM